MSKEARVARGKYLTSMSYDDKVIWGKLIERDLMAARTIEELMDAYDSGLSVSGTFVSGDLFNLMKNLQSGFNRLEEDLTIEQLQNVCYNSKYNSGVFLIAKERWEEKSLEEAKSAVTFDEANSAFEKSPGGNGAARRLAHEKSRDFSVGKITALKASQEARSLYSSKGYIQEIDIALMLLKKWAELANEEFKETGIIESAEDNYDMICDGEGSLSHGTGEFRNEVLGYLNYNLSMAYKKRIMSAETFEELEKYFNKAKSRGLMTKGMKDRWVELFLKKVEEASTTAQLRQIYSNLPPDDVQARKSLYEKYSKLSIDGV